MELVLAGKLAPARVVVLELGHRPPLAVDVAQLLELRLRVESRNTGP